MTLIFTTRKVDKNDERTGFVSEWLIEFSKHLTKLIVICQEVGDISNLPANVEVYSLGKEKSKNKFQQFFTCLLLLVTKIPKTDGIFSHMVPHFAVLAGPFCKFYHKKLIQWYVHKTISPWLKLADFFVDEYVTTNAESFQLKTEKPIHYFGHGININKFKHSSVIPAGLALNQGDRAGIQCFKILSVSRISPSKNIHLMIQTIEKILITHPELKDKIQLQIIGAPGLKEQQKYYNSLTDYIAENKLNNNIQLLGPMSPEKVLPYYQNCDLFLNLSDTGSVDKAVLEATACEKLILTSNIAFKNIVPAQLFLNVGAQNLVPLLADKILEIYNLPESEKETLQKSLRQEVVNNHNLKNLAQKIINIF